MYRPIRLFSIFILFLGANAFAGTPLQESQKSIRPSISISWNDSGLPLDPIKLLKAEISANLFILSFYPDHEIYFLARDAERLGRVSGELAIRHPELTPSRSHILHVSRDSGSSSLLKQYLGENGITEQALTGGKKILLVDTGFKGTLIQAISSEFSDLAQGNIKGHMLYNANQRFPSSHVFSKEAGSVYSETLNAIVDSAYFQVKQYASFPKDKGKLVDYRLGKDGKVELVRSLVGDENDGLIDPIRTEAEWKKSLAYVDSDEGKKFITQRKKFFQALSKAKNPFLEIDKLMREHGISSPDFRSAVLNDLADLQKYSGFFKGVKTPKIEQYWKFDRDHSGHPDWNTGIIENCRKLYRSLLHSK